LRLNLKIKEIVESKRKGELSLSEDMPEVPDRCQWGRHCLGCPWPGCVLAGRCYSFGSPETVEFSVSPKTIQRSLAKVKNYGETS